MNEDKPDFLSILTKASKPGFYVKVILKNKEEHIGTVDPSKDSPKWCIVTPKKNHGNATGNVEFSFSIDEIESIEVVS